MRNHGCKNIIFSTSAYSIGRLVEIPINENCSKGFVPIPMLHHVLMDVQKADNEWIVVILRDLILWVHILLAE